MSFVKNKIKLNSAMHDLFHSLDFSSLCVGSGGGGDGVCVLVVVVCVCGCGVCVRAGGF